jgi:hypothetical protein
MRADYSISCSSQRYYTGRYWAIVMIFVYPVGIPSYYFYLLHNAKHEIQFRNNINALSNHLKLRYESVLNPIIFLYDIYQPQYWYWEIIETIQRLFLCGVLVIIQPGTYTQIIIAIIISIIYIHIYNIYQPYYTLYISKCKIIIQYQIFFILFITILIKINIFYNYFIGIIMIIIVLSTIIYDILLLIFKWIQIKFPIFNDKNRNNRLMIDDLLFTSNECDDNEDINVIQKQLRDAIRQQQDITSRIDFLQDQILHMKNNTSVTLGLKGEEYSTTENVLNSDRNSGAMSNRISNVDNAERTISTVEMEHLHQKYNIQY